MDSELRRYRPQDRPTAHAVLRRQLIAGRVPYAIHPGDWDWWCFHHDPRTPQPQALIGDHALVEVTHRGELSAFGLTPEQLIEVLDDPRLPGPVGQVDWVSEQDADREGALAAAGFEPTTDPPTLTFERRLTVERPLSTEAADVAPFPAPDGYLIRVLDAGSDAQVRARADAARLAFGSTMPVDQHRARYLGFTRSPGYRDCLDLVAVPLDPAVPLDSGRPVDGEVAAFTVFWPDDESSTVQLEPVGTHPEHRRRGLARAVIRQGLSRMAARGIRTARVMTDQGRPAAPDLYLACGFTVVDRLRRWHRPVRGGHARG